MARRTTRGNSRCEKQLRERKYRLRNRASKFIPAGDSDFAHMARMFAGHCAEHAERFGLSAEQVAKVTAAVEEYRGALYRTMLSDTCGPKATRIKNTARANAEALIRGSARILRGAADESITSVDRLMLNLHERPKRLKRRECPQVAPVLKFKGSSQPDWAGGGSSGRRHILEYGNDFDLGSSAKPHGAARLELFVELVPPEWVKTGNIPAHPAQVSGGRLWYLGSFSTSRFEVEFPVMADGSSMLVVYWGRWADARGGVGPFSRTCKACVEGGVVSQNALYVGAQRPTQRMESKRVVIQAPYQLPERIESDALNIAETRMLPMRQT